MRRRGDDDLLARLLEQRAQAAYGGPVAGVDEAGRGPLAGPVMVGAVVLPQRLRGAGRLADSKRLTAAERQELAAWLRTVAVAWAVRRVGPRTVDRLGIAQATHLGMVRAVAALGSEVRLALIDGPVAPTPTGVRGLRVVDGDRIAAAVMAAAILAKTARDREMVAWHRHFPAYGFDRHKGYGTREHLLALARLGPCPIHRRSFLPAVTATDWDAT